MSAPHVSDKNDLARDFSILPDEELPDFFSGHGTSFRGAFGRGGLGVVNQYGSWAQEEGEAPLEKWTSLSNIVPAGVHLNPMGEQLQAAEVQGKDGEQRVRKGGSGAAAQQRRPPPMFAQRQLQQQQLAPQAKEKQGSQQRGPGRPTAELAPALRPHPTVAAAAEPSGRATTPGAVAVPSMDAGPMGPACPQQQQPQQPAPKKLFKLKVKLNGKLVGGQGGAGGPGSQTTATHSEETPVTTIMMVDAMCGLGAPQLLSPLPSQWGRILEQAGPESAAAPAPAAVQQRQQQGGQEAREGAQQGAAVCGRSSASPSRTSLPFASQEVHAQAQQQLQAEQQQLQQHRGEADLGAAAPGAAAGPSLQAEGAAAAEPASGGAVRSGARAEAAASVQPPSLLSPLPSIWGHVVGVAPDAQAATPAAPSVHAEGSAVTVAAEGVQRGGQGDTQQATTQALKVGSKRGLQPGGVATEGRDGQGSGASSRGGEALPRSTKRVRAASAEPSGGAKEAVQAEAAGTADKRVVMVGHSLAAVTGLAVLSQPSREQQQPRAAVTSVSSPNKQPVPGPALGQAPPTIPPQGDFTGSRGPCSSHPTSPGSNAQPSGCEAAAAAAQQERSAQGAPAAATGAQQQQQQQGGQPAATPLGAVAAGLHAAVQAAAEQAAAAPNSTLAQLQDEGRRLKRFAEKKMVGDRHTHVSCTFLLSSGLKFLAAAGIMESAQHKYSRDSASTMFSQTAAMLESCAHASLRAEGPPLGTQVVALLAERLAAVARLRAAHCLRNELNRDAAAFRIAVESARGETFQRPSPTDSNVSATVSLPLEGCSPSAAARKRSPPSASQQQQQPGSAATSPAGKGSGRKGGGGGGRGEEAAAAAGVPALLGIPRAIADRELGMAGHMQGVLAALSAFSRSADRLRDLMSKAAAEGNPHAMRSAAGALLLSADAGMGRLEAIVSIGREALDAAMKIEA